MTGNKPKLEDPVNINAYRYKQFVEIYYICS